MRRRGFYHPHHLRAVRLELIEIWMRQLERFPESDITRTEVAGTLKAFLSYDPEAHG